MSEEFQDEEHRKVVQEYPIKDPEAYSKLYDEYEIIDRSDKLIEARRKPKDDTKK